MLFIMCMFDVLSLEGLFDLFVWLVSVLFGCYVLFFFFKQKTAYEMRISDWSSDVCSSDLEKATRLPVQEGLPRHATQSPQKLERLGRFLVERQIGRASCRERVCQYV